MRKAFSCNAQMSKDVMSELIEFFNLPLVVVGAVEDGLVIVSIDEVYRYYAEQFENLKWDTFVASTNCLDKRIEDFYHPGFTTWDRQERLIHVRMCEEALDDVTAQQGYTHFCDEHDLICVEVL